MVQEFRELLGYTPHETFTRKTKADTPIPMLWFVEDELDEIEYVLGARLRHVEVVGRVVADRE